MISSKHNGTVYTVRKLENGEFSACAFIGGVKVVVVNEKRRVAVASIRAHIDDAVAEIAENHLTHADALR